jgi:hypothetical protein
MKLTTEIYYEGTPLTVEYIYQPEEGCEIGREAQYAGCKESIDEICNVKYKGFSLLGLYKYDLKGIENAVWNKIQEDKKLYKDNRYEE